MSQLDTFPNLRVFVPAIQLESCRYSGFYSSWLRDTPILFVNHDAAGASIVQPLAVYTRHQRAPTFVLTSMISTPVPSRTGPPQPP